jgi:thiamine-monophosphate kinase
VGEFDLIERYFRVPSQQMIERLAASQRPLLGIGDDCALISLAGKPGEVTAISSDMLVEGVHFFSDVAPRHLGHKALAVNLSDLAAMGAQPKGFTLALSLPRIDEPWLADFSLGLFALAEQFACPLIGGDTTRGPLNICITVFGSVASSNVLRRSGARQGDDLWVSGSLGGAAWALSRLEQKRISFTSAIEIDALQALEQPTPRVELGKLLAAEGLANSAMDLSDGLSGDLAHLLAQSRVPGVLLDWDNLPWHECLKNASDAEKIRFALQGGDDYELLFSADSTHREALLKLTTTLPLPLTRIGSLSVLPGIRWRNAPKDLPALALGQAFNHFNRN